MNSLGTFSCQLVIDGIETSRDAEVFMQSDRNLDLIVKIRVTQQNRFERFLARG